MFEEWKIKKTLRRLSKQRVALVLSPVNVWVIERALKPTEQQIAHLQTCMMRGWIEVLHDQVPSQQMPADISTWAPKFDSAKPIYRITDSGWAIINKSQMIAVISLAATTISLATLLQ